MNNVRQDYVLADKLKRQFRGRGADLSGMRASSTSELMRMAEMGHDPRENCAEQAFRESYNRRAKTAYSTPKKAAYSAPQKSSAASKIKRTYNSAAGVKNAGVKNSTAKNQTAKKTEPETEKITPAAEIRVKKKLLSPIFVIFLGAVTIMVLFLVTEISNVYRAANEISELENTLTEMQNQAEALELKLEEKNDIREIERIATTELGMAKEDTLQRRYVSLSDGERIEILDSREENEDMSGGVMLSSIFSSIGKLLGGE